MLLVVHECILRKGRLAILPFPRFALPRVNTKFKVVVVSVCTEPCPPKPLRHLQHPEVAEKVADMRRFDDSSRRSLSRTRALLR
jgi:hypothetical protein